MKDSPQLSEAEKKVIYSEFYRFFNSPRTMMETMSRGLRDREALAYALEKASDHIESSYSLSFDQVREILNEGNTTGWSK